MATNLDKLKSEIAEMSAEEFRQKLAQYIDFYSNFNQYCSKQCSIEECRKCGDCYTCLERWLNLESEEKE